VNAQLLRRRMVQEFNALWKKVDCLFTPTTPTAAPRIGQNTVIVGGREEDARLAGTRLVRSINVLGLPALPIRCGFSDAGLPLGLQIIVPAFRECLIRGAG